MPTPTSPFDITKSIFAGLSVIQLRLLPTVTGVTAAAATDIISKAGHTFTDGQAVSFVSGTGFTGLVGGTTYFARDVVAGVSFKLAATKGGAAVDITVDGTVGIFQPVSVFESRMLTHKDNREYKELERAGSDGVLRTVRRVCVKGKEEMTYEIDEGKRLVTELFQGALSGIRTATATIWEPDPQDAAGKVALKSDVDFPCDITRDGDFKLGDSDFSKAQIKITSNKNGDVLWTVDGNA